MHSVKIRSLLSYGVSSHNFSFVNFSKSNPVAFAKAKGDLPMSYFCGSWSISKGCDCPLATQKDGGRAQSWSRQAQNWLSLFVAEVKWFICPLALRTFEECIKDWMVENSWTISNQSQSLWFTPGDLLAVVPQEDFLMESDLSSLFYQSQKSMLPFSGFPRWTEGSVVGRYCSVLGSKIQWTYFYLFMI